MRLSKIECECGHLHVSHRKRGEKIKCLRAGCTCVEFRGKKL